MASNTATTAQPAPKQSLCATHPFNYAQPTKHAMPPPPPPPPPQKRVGGGVPRSANGYPTPSPSPPQTAQDSIPDPLQVEQSRSSIQTQQLHRLDPKLGHSATASNGANRKKAELPWEQHSDPTLTASDAPVFWSRNHTVLKSDTGLENGNVVSPTFMHGLPFGTLIEAAYHYPTQERQTRRC